MGIEVDVVVKGLSVAYRDSDFWNVVFLCDAHHTVRFEVDGRAHPSYPNLGVIGKRRTVEFKTNKIAQPSAPIGQSSILNLAADYAHGATDLRRVPSRLSSSVHLRLPNAKLRPGDMNDASWFGYVQDADRPGSPPMLISSMAKSIVFTIEVPYGANLDVQMSNDNGPEDVLAIPSIGKVQLVFDNDCKANCHGNDSIQVYRFLQSISGRRFYTGYVYGKDARFPSPEQVEAWEQDPEANKGPFTTRMGNCDPAIVEPPPMEI